MATLVRAAGIEHGVSDTGKGVGHRDAAQVGAVLKGPDPNRGDVGGDGDTGKFDAAGERVVRNGGHAAGDRIAASSATRILQERGLSFVEQDPLHAAIDRVGRIHREGSNASAVIERVVSDVAGPSCRY